MRVVLIFSLIFGIVYANENTVSVQVKSTVLRDKPSFLGKKLANLKYAQTVKLQKQQGAWAKVFVNNLKKNGWLHSSALSDKRIVLKQNGYNVGTSASSGEIIMAGKGFSKEVEDQYRATHRNLNYTLVDAVERQSISNHTLQKFASNGKLTVNNR